MGKRAYRGGFTLIELSLSLVFIAILSVTVVLLIQNTVASYRRGLVLNQVNTVGMDLVDDFRTSVQNASSDSIIKMCEMYYDKNDGGSGLANYNRCVADNGNSFVSVTRRAEVKVEGASLGSIPVFGVFCTGTYTYVWNSGYFESSDIKTELSGTPTRTVVGFSEGAMVGTQASATSSFNTVYSNFRLLKLYDDERSICVNAMKAQDVSGGGNNYVASTSYQQNLITNRFVMSQNAYNENEVSSSTIDGTGGIEMLKKNDASDLVLYDLYVAKPALSATRKNAFYSAAFILGTRRGGINIKEAGNSCKPPSDDYSELEYCAINKFNFAVQAGGA